jgi:hypothetical protein
MSKIDALANKVLPQNLSMPSALMVLVITQKLEGREAKQVSLNVD